MKILISGGTGLIGRALTKAFIIAGHDVWILTRRERKTESGENVKVFHWDGKTMGGWADLVDKVDVVINLAGETLAKWPWTNRRKKRFLDSRIIPGTLLNNAIMNSKTPPGIFIQISGVNIYGSDGEEIVTEESPLGEDFLSRLSIAWENSTRDIENIGVRRIILRTAIVLSSPGGLLDLMTLPVRLYFGGRFGSGKQYVPWIHIDDLVSAVIYLIDREDQSGVFNLVAPEAVTNEAFNKALARVLHKPYWFSVPSILLRLILGEMNVLVLKGRNIKPTRLQDAGFSFRYGVLEDAFCSLFIKNG